MNSNLHHRLNQLEANAGCAALQPPGPEATNQERCAYVVRATAHQHGQPMSETEAQYKANQVLSTLQAMEQMQGRYP